MIRFLLLIPLLLPTDEITREEMRSHVEYLASDALEGRAPGTEGWRKAAAYIEKEYRRIGLLPVGDDESYFQDFGIPLLRGRNILGLLPGRRGPDRSEVIIIASHYDHLGVRDGEIYNGANDNASGMAVMLEVAEALARNKTRLERSVLFACFDQEEKGFLGSFYYVSHPVVPLEQTALMINLEVLGADILEGLHHTLFAAGSEYDSREIVGSRLRSLTPDSGLEIHPLSHSLIGWRSDHVPFRLAGVPFLFLASGTHHTYHQPEDDPETLDYVKLEKTGRFVRDLVLALAEDDRRPVFGEPEEPITVADARILGRVARAMMDEKERLGLTEDEEAFLLRAIQRMDRIAKYEKTTAIDRTLIRYSFVRALMLLGTATQ